MSYQRFSGTVLAVGLGCFLLTACVDTGIKTLGKKPENGTGNATTDGDSFSITLAYRDSTSTDSTVTRTISLQGTRGVPSANLVNICGATGNTCQCLFYRTTTDSSPIASASVGISEKNNSFSCVMSSSIADPSVFKYVRLKSTVTGANQATGMIDVKNTLTLEDLLGSDLSKAKVRGIYRYSCSRTFFEGEGVTSEQLYCTPSQRLGVISASYHYYTYRDSTTSNSPGGDSAFTSSICGRSNWLKIRCTGNTPDLRYGFYGEPKEPFLVGIQMVRAPEAAQGDTAPLKEIYGYAALPDSAGNCPTGLIKVRPYQAQPASIIEGSISTSPSNPPSNFINAGNGLNNTVVEQATPSNFAVSRQPNATPCDATATDGVYSCANATFGGTTVAQSVSYTGLTPVVCVIPPDLLSGLF